MGRAKAGTGRNGEKRCCRTSLRERDGELGKGRKVISEKRGGTAPSYGRAGRRISGASRPTRAEPVSAPRLPLPKVCLGMLLLLSRCSRAGRADTCAELHGGRAGKGPGRGRERAGKRQGRGRERAGKRPGRGRHPHLAALPSSGEPPPAPARIGRSLRPPLPPSFSLLRGVGFNPPPPSLGRG